MGELAQDKETGQALQMNITFSPLTNPIPNETRSGAQAKETYYREELRRCDALVQAPVLSFCGLTVGSSGSYNEQLQDIKDLSLLVYHG